MPVGVIAVSRLAPAPRPARLAALALDLLVGIGFAILFSLAALIWLLWRSDAGQRQPSDPSIYVAILLLSAWIPVWAAYSLRCYVRHSQTPGLAAMSLIVADQRGERPGFGPGLVRLFGLAAGVGLFFAACVTGIAAAAAAAQGTLPVAAFLLAALVVFAGLAEPVYWALSPGSRALHDRLSGTQVVRYVPLTPAGQELGNHVS